MQLEIIILSEVCQKERDTISYNMILLRHGIQNMTQINLFMKLKQTHKHREQTCGCQGEVGGWTGNLGLADTNYCV